MILGMLLVPIVLGAQTKPFVSHPDQLEDDAYAEWIAPEINTGVFYFRRQFSLDSIPGKYVVYVSADARYNLYVNGTLVSRGPAAGDLEHWNYETMDLAPHLKKGNNVIGSQVWNHGRLNGARQITHRTAFILQGASTLEQAVNTSSGWKVIRDKGYHALAMTGEIVGGGYIAGCTDSLVAEKHPWNWNQPGYDDSAWSPAAELGKGNHSGLDTWKGTRWKLQPRKIPVMEEKKEDPPRIILVKGIPDLGTGDGRLPISIPPASHVEILMDNRVMTMGFPRLTVAGGSGSQIKIRYQEALFDENDRKENRDRWEGKTMKGYYDVLMPDGGERSFEPLWIRVFRYIKIIVDTRDDPLEIRGFHNLYTAYPLEQKASFSSTDDTLKEIWNASWRTVRLCALETYMDCPYYEQLQYIGDSRIQALISMYVAGDDRLARNAIRQFYASLQPMGLTKSAHPTAGVQIIPPYSLLFISMIHDHYMLRDDPEFIRQFVPGIRFILEWFIRRIDENGIMGPLSYWNHIDGGTGFTNGSPPGISEGGSAHMSLLLTYAMDDAIDLMKEYGFPCDAERFQRISDQLKTRTVTLCYSKEKHLIAETPSKKEYSQHTNIFGILTDAIPPADQQRVARIILEDTTLIGTTLYFKYYLFRVLKKVGLGGKVPGMMQEWKIFLDRGFTTFPEHGINSRSDCHAWSAHPMIDFLTIVCGIESASPGFRSVEIRPGPGELKQVTGSVPHPEGMIHTSYDRRGKNKWECRIILPEHVKGTLVWDEKPYPLKGGENSYVFQW